MKHYKSRFSTLSGTSRDELIKLARKHYHAIQKRTPRRVPYVRSAYFNKDKIFITTFWKHLQQKQRPDQVRRLKYYMCAIDLLRHSTHTPITTFKTDASDYAFHRFYGRTGHGEPFVVQVKGHRQLVEKNSCRSTRQLRSENEAP